MDDAELNRAVAAARNQRLDPPCARYHETDAAEYDSEIGWGGWCYTCGKSISEVAPEPTRVCTDPAAWGGLHNELKEAGYVIHMSTYQNVTTVKIVDLKAAYSGDADDAETGRAFAYAFLRVKRVLPEEA
jgi:hypothetical protein